jgi:hypothetical protein
MGVAEMSSVTKIETIRLKSQILTTKIAMLDLADMLSQYPSKRSKSREIADMLAEWWEEDV